MRNTSAVDSSQAGNTYVAEAAGNMIGGIVFTFFMIRHLSPLESSIMAGAVMVAAFLTIKSPNQKRSNGKKKNLISLISVVQLILAVVTFPYLKEIDNWGYGIQ